MPLPASDADLIALDRYLLHQVQNLKVRVRVRVRKH